MKKFVLSFGIILIFATYTIFARKDKNSPATTVVPAQTPAASNTVAQPNPNMVTGTTAIQKTSPAPAPKPAALYKDGNYSGSVADAFFGNIQVQAIISGGKLSDVIFLQYPNDRGNSITINGRAMPILKSEAIAAQSANVNIVSGATQTSQAFQQSLASALTQAK